MRTRVTVTIKIYFTVYKISLMMIRCNKRKRNMPKERSRTIFSCSAYDMIKRGTKYHRLTSNYIASA